MNIKATYRLTCKRCGSIFDSPICVEYCSSCNSLPFIKDSNIEEPTLRDQFAMAVLTGTLARNTRSLPADLASDCYRYADAMLEARKK